MFKLAMVSMFMILFIQIYYLYKERLRHALIIYQMIKKNDFEQSQIKLIVLWLFQGIQWSLDIMIIWAAFDHLTLSTDGIEMLNNTLSVLVLQQIDNMTSAVYLNWVRTNYQIFSMSNDFMQIESNMAIERAIEIPSYFFSPVIICYFMYIQIVNPSFRLK